MPDWLDMYISPWEAMARLGIALLFGAVVGFEREARQRSAGLRTHMLISLGSAGFTLIAAELMQWEIAHGRAGQLETRRIIGAIVGGIGFLGAGAIIHSGRDVKGLTTAAGMWTVAAVGMAAGLGFYAVTIMLTLGAVLTLAAVLPLERWMGSRDDDDEAAGGDDRAKRGA